jgi:hypothetical protein
VIFDFAKLSDLFCHGCIKVEMCNLHHLHKKFPFQNQTANDIKNDLFPDSNQFVSPSPPFNFRELPEPPTITKEQINTAAKTSSKNIALGKVSNAEAETIEDTGGKKNDSIYKLKEDTKYNRKEETQLLKSENAGEQKKEDDDICPKCHHKKGIRKRKNVKKNEKLKNVDDSDLSKKRQKEEKEILQNYIKEPPSLDHFCNCSIHGVDYKHLKQRKVNNNKYKS